jgi:hypothetical protein
MLDALIAFIQNICEQALPFIEIITWPVWALLKSVIVWLDFDPFLSLLDQLDPSSLGETWTVGIGFIMHWVPFDFAFNLIALAVGIIGLAVLFKSVYKLIQLSLH